MKDELEGQLAFECQLEEPPARVWRALTEPALLTAWLMPNDFEPVVGHEFQFRESERAAPIDCTVLELDAERRLRLRWRESDAVPPLDSEVTFTLEPAVGGGTHLRLVHSGLPTRLRAALPALATASTYAGAYELPFFRCAA